MSPPPALLWLPSAQNDPPLVAAQQSGLPASGVQVVTVPVREVLDPRRPDLAAAVAAVRKWLVDPSRYAVFGAGAGALVALRLAGEHPGEVAWTAVTVTPPEGPSPVRSVWAAARRLLPATALATLGSRPDEVWWALDSLRPADYRDLAPRVGCPAFVLAGAKDAAARPVARTLARRLPHGTVRLVPGAGPGWPVTHPRRVGEALAEIWTAPT